jgi:hypothetical protein
LAISRRIWQKSSLCQVVFALGFAFLWLGCQAETESEEVTGVGAVPATPLDQHVSLLPVDGFVSAHALMQINQAGAEKDAIALMAARSGAKFIRIDIAWQDIEFSRGSYDFTNADRSLQAVANANSAHPQRPPLQIVAVIQQTPPWASSRPDCLLCPPYAIYPPKDLQSWVGWQAFVTALVNRYGARGTQQVSVWEIWNEPNLSAFWAGTAADYAKLFSLAYDAIKCVPGQAGCGAGGADPSATVLLGGLSSDRLKEPSSFASFVGDVLNDQAEGGRFAAKGRIDAINLHLRGPISKILRYVDEWRTVFANAGAELDKPLWITEFAWPSSALFQRVESDSDPNNTTTYSGDPATIHFVEMSDDDSRAMAKQAQYYYAVLPRLFAKGVAAVFVTLRDLPEGAGSQWSWEGLIDRDYAIKIPDAAKPNQSSFHTTALLNSKTL